MNEQAVEHAYNLFQADGYEDSIDDFQSLLQTNGDAVSHAYNLFKNDGYQDTMEDFETLLGLKKKDQTEQEESSSVLGDGTSDVEDGSLVLGESEEVEEGPSQIFDELKDSDGGSLATNLSPDDTSHMVDLSQAFPEIKKLPSEKENYNSRLIDPKAAQFLRELKEIYPEKDFNELQITSGYRDQKHHHFYESERKGEKPTSNVHSRHKHGLALDFGYDSGKKLMEFLLNDPNGQALAKKWGEGGNLGNGIHDEFIDMYAKKHDRNHLHFSFKRGQIVNEDYAPIQDTSISLDEEIDENVFEEEKIEDEIEETIPEETGSMDNPGLYGGFNSEAVVETPELFDEYSIDAELDKLYNPEISEEEKSGIIDIIKKKSYNSNGQKRMVNKFPVNQLLDSNGDVLIEGRDVYMSYDVDENGDKTYKVVDPILGEFVSGSKSKNDAIRELEKKLQEKKEEGNEKAFKDLERGVTVVPPGILEEISQLEEQLNQLKSSRSGEKDALIQWMIANQSLLLSKDVDSFGEEEDSFFNQLTKWNRTSQGEIGLFLNAMETAYNDAPHTTDTPEELLSYDLLDYDGYTEGEGLTSMLTNEAYDMGNIAVHSRTNLERLLGKEYERIDARLSEQIESIKMINNDEVTKFFWRLYNFNGFDENFTEEDYKKLEYLDKRLEKSFNKGKYDPSELITWLKLQEKRQFAFSQFSGNQLRAHTERITSKLAKNGGLQEYEELKKEMGSLTDEQIVIKNKLEKPEGYIYFDKEEYDSDQELIKRYNEIVGLKNELLENEKALKEKYPEFNSFIGVMEIQDSLEEHAMVIQERPELLRAHQKWVREQQKEADEKHRDRSDFGNAIRWVGGVAEEFLTTLGQGLFLDFPRLVDGFIRNEYNAIDLRSDEMHETLSQGFHRIFADDHFNEKGAGGFSQYVVDMGDGHKIMVDRDGNPMETYFEDEDGYMIRTDSEKNEELLNLYLDKKDNYVINKETNYTAGFNMLTDAITTFAGDVVLTYGTMGVGSAVGLGKLGYGSANTWRRVAMGTSMWVNHSGGLYNMAKEQGMTDREASSYATLMSGIFGLTNAYISPNLGILGATPGIAKRKTSTAMLSMLLGAAPQNTLKATGKHMLIEGVKEGTQELVDEQVQSWVGQIYNHYKDTDFQKLHYDQARDASIAGFVIGMGASVNSRPTASSMQVASMYQAYKYKSKVFESLDNMVGETININGKRVKLTKSFINNKKAEMQHLFNQVDSVKSEAGVKLGHESEATLVSLIKRRNHIEAFQGDKKFGKIFKEEIGRIDNQVSRILKGESIDSIFYKESSFDKLGIDKNKVSYAARFAERMFRTKGKWRNTHKAAVEQQLESEIEALNNKSNLKPEEKAILRTYRALLKKVKKVKPTINEQITETTKLAISKTSPGLRAKIERLTQRLKGKGVGKDTGDLSTTEEVVFDETSTFSESLGNEITYAGKKGKLVKNKNGQYAIESGGRKYVIENATGRKMLKSAGVSTDPIILSMDGDKLVLNRGKQKRVLEVVRGANNEVGGVLTVDEKTFSNKRRLNKIRKELQKLSEQYAKGEINLATFRRKAKAISGVELLTNKDVSLDVRANQLISQIMSAVDVASISMSELDAIIEEASEEIETLKDLEKSFKRAVKKEVKNSRKIRGEVNNPGTRVKKGENTLNEMSENEPNRIKSKILKIANNVMSSIGFDVVVHNDSNSVYEHFILQDYSHQDAEIYSNQRGFVYEKNGTIHLNLQTATLNTMFHEGAHPFVSVLRNLSQQKGEKADAAKKILNEAKEFLNKKNIAGKKENGTYIDWAKRTYSHLSADEQFEEAFAEYLGDAALTEYEKNNTWAKGIWRKILGLFGINVDSNFDAYTKTMEDVSDLGEFTEVFSQKIARGQELDLGKVEGTEPKFQYNIDEQIDAHHAGDPNNLTEETGSTFNDLFGDVSGKPYTSVSIFTDRTKKIKGKKITRKDIRDFIKKNKFILDQHESLAVGTWFNPDDGFTYIDISSVVPKSKQKQAEALGKKHNQISIFNLENFEYIDTGGDGKNINHTSENLQERINTIQDIVGDLKPPKFQAGTQVELNHLEQAVNSIQMDRATKEEILKQINIHSTPLTKLELEFSGLENYLEGLKLDYNDQLIPIQAVKDYVEMNKVSIDNISENELSIKNPMMDLGKVKFRMDDSIDETGPKTMVVEELDGVGFGFLDTVFKNIVKYAVDSNLSRVVFSNKTVSNDASFDVLEEAIQSIDSGSDIGLIELDGQPSPQVIVSNNMIRNTTKINHPKFQAAGRDILDNQTRERVIIRRKFFGLDLNYLAEFVWVGGKASGAILEARELGKGRRKAMIDVVEYLVKDLRSILKKHPDLSGQDITDALTDPTNSEGAIKIQRDIKEIKKELEMLSALKDKSAKYTKLEKDLKSKEKQLRNIKKGHKNKYKLDSMPEEVKNKIQEIRDYIDSLSQALIESGLLTEKMSIKYSENKGLYLTRSYKTHQQSKPRGWAMDLKKAFAEKIFGKQHHDLKSIKRNQKLYNKAKDYFRKQIFNSYSEQYKADNNISKPEDVPEHEVDEIINEIINPREKSPVRIISKVGPSLSRYLKERKGEEQLPKIIRDILGEVNDPFTNVLTTVTKQVNMLEGMRYHKFLVDTYSTGDKPLLVPEGQTIPKYWRDQGMKVQDETEITLIVDGKAKKFTTLKSLVPALLGKNNPGKMDYTGGLTDVIAIPVNGYLWTLGTFKLFKTVGSSATQLTNFFANIIYALRMGHINVFKHGIKGFQTTFLAMGKWNTGKKQELYRELLEYGVIDSAGVSELKMLLEEGGYKFFEDPNFNPIDEIVGTQPGFLGANWLRSGLSKGKKAALSAYMFGDVSWKANAWLHEVDRMKKAGYSGIDAKRIASQIVRETYPTYQNVPKAVKAMGMLPFGGLFVSYPFEVYRTTYNTGNRARKEIMEGLRTGNSQLLQVGMMRLGSFATSMYYSSYVAKAQVYAFAFLTNAMKGLLSDDEEEVVDDTGKFEISELNEDYIFNEEMGNDMRILMPIYYEDNDVVVIGHPETGVWKYINATRHDAVGGLWSLLRSATDPIKNPIHDYFINNKFIYRLLSDFIPGGKQKIYEVFNEIKDNDKNLNNDYDLDVIWREGDDEHTKVLKALKHILKDVSPTVLTHISDVVMASLQKPQDGVKAGWRRVEEGELLPKGAKTEILSDGTGKIVNLKSIDEEKDLVAEIRRIMGHSEGHLNLAQSYRFNAQSARFKIENYINNVGAPYEETKEKTVEFIEHMREVLRVSNKYGLGHMEYIPRNPDKAGVIKGEGGNSVASVILRDLGMPKNYISLFLGTGDIETNPYFNELINEKMYEEILKEQKLKDK